MTKQEIDNMATTSSVDPLDQLQKAIVTCNEHLAISSAKKAIAQGIDPVKVAEAMTMVLRLVGDAFGKGELWLPDLVGAATAMLSAMPIVEEEIEKQGAKRESLGTIVIGTVFGDIHTIGKTMVASLLSAEGFLVHDIGVSVKDLEFVKAVKTYNADILAMSALMTLTAIEQRKVIDALKKAGIREKVKVIIGGAAVTQEFADSIGADGYETTAPRGVQLARALVGK